MAVDREALFVALFDRLSSLDGFVYASRIFRSWDDTPAAEMPTLYLTKSDETSRYSVQGLPTLWRFEAHATLYIGNDALEPASTRINAIITAVEAALERKPMDGPLPGYGFPANPNGGTFGTTLGGLCYACQISGTVQVFEGIISNDAVVMIPIEMLTTGAS